MEISAEARKRKIYFYFANGVWISGLILGIIVQLLFGMKDAPVMLSVLMFTVPIAAILYLIYFVKLFRERKEMDERIK